MLLFWTYKKIKYNRCNLIKSLGFLLFVLIITKYVCVSAVCLRQKRKLKRAVSLEEIDLNQMNVRVDSWN